MVLIHTALSNRPQYHTQTAMADKKKKKKRNTHGQWQSCLYRTTAKGCQSRVTLYHSQEETNEGMKEKNERRKELEKYRNKEGTNKCRNIKKEDINV